MVHNFFDIPLCQWFKNGSFREDHAKNGVDVLNAAFLVAAHRITIINASSLHAIRIRFKAVWNAEFSAPVCQDQGKHRDEFISPA